MTWTERRIRWAGTAGLVAFIMGSSLAFKTPDRAAAMETAKVERGRYLVEAMGCHDCHTPKKMGPNGLDFDRTRALSGHPEGSELPPPPRLPEGPWIAVASWDFTAWSGPWGVSYPINLTPDENTGIGIWTEEIFVKTMRTGRHWGVARPILPPMPWQSLNALDDGDLKAVFAYLRSLPPIKNRVPQPVINEDGD